MMIFLSSILNVSYADVNKELDVPDYVEIGDVLIMEFQEFYNPLQNEGFPNDHIAIYIGNNDFVHAKPYSKVEIKDYEYFQENYNYPYFGYVKNASKNLKEDAGKWAEEQVGRRYQNIKKSSAKGKNNRWYDSELIWAAYYNQGIDIDLDSDENTNIVEIPEIVMHPEFEAYVAYEIPSFLKKGDIIMMDIYHDNVWDIEGHSNDHAVMYMGKDFRNGQYVIHASSGGVQYTTFDVVNFVYRNLTFYNVNNADENTRDAAVRWAVDHLGYKYQYFFPQTVYPGMWEFGLKCENIDNPNVLTSDRFYCMEIIWASYYNNGIDIDNNGWEKIYPEAPSQLGIFAKLWQLVEGILFEPFAYINGNDIQCSQNTTQYLMTN